MDTEQIADTAPVPPASEVRVCCSCSATWSVPLSHGHPIEASHYLETPIGTMCTGTTRECPQCHDPRWTRAS
jgi:hypothetical protein